MSSYALLVAATLGVFVLCAFVCSADAATDYCTLCSGGSQHIACNNNGAFGPKCASNAQAITITNTLKTTILHRHNTLRNTIAQGAVSEFKPAGRMASMQWDDELAALALLNAKQCAMVHDQCRATTQFPYAGQNLAYSGWSGTTRNVDEVALQHIQMWYDENKDATMSQIDKYVSNGKVVGHFTQMMLEKATHVGCGIVRQTSGMTYQYMACNYAFITFLNRPVYTSAATGGAQCSTGTHPTYTSLCNINEVFDVKKP